MTLKKGAWIVFVAVLLLGLYGIEYSKVRPLDLSGLPTLDALTIDESARGWEPFHRVRAKLLDGQRATVRLPHELKQQIGLPIKLTGAAVFFGNGVRTINAQTVAVDAFYLIPSHSLVGSCDTLPDVEMRWTILVTLREPWLMRRVDMIDTQVVVNGQFRFDSSRPYEAVFFVDDATIHRVTEKE